MRTVASTILLSAALVLGACGGAKRPTAAESAASKGFPLAATPLVDAVPPDNAALANNGSQTDRDQAALAEANDGTATGGANSSRGVGEERPSTARAEKPGGGAPANPPPSILIGEPPPDVNPSTCSLPAQQVIAAAGLTPIVQCTSTAFDSPNGPVHYTLIHYGQGMDCPSGCIFKRQAAVVNSGVTLLPAPFPTLEALRLMVMERYGVALPGDLSTYTKVRMEFGKGGWQMVVTFTKHLSGTAILLPDEGAQGIRLALEPIPGDMDRTALRQTVWAKVQAECASSSAALLDFYPQPSKDGSWSGVIVWGNWENYVKTMFMTTVDGTVAFPQGCDPRTTPAPPTSVPPVTPEPDRPLPFPKDGQSRVWAAVLSQCRPSSDAKILNFYVDSGSTEKGWAGLIVWGTQADYVKTPYGMKLDGTIALPQGCDPRNPGKV